MRPLSLGLIIGILFSSTPPAARQILGPAIGGRHRTGPTGVFIPRNDKRPASWAIIPDGLSLSLDLPFDLSIAHPLAGPLGPQRETVPPFRAPPLRRIETGITRALRPLQKGTALPAGDAKQIGLKIQTLLSGWKPLVLSGAITAPKSFRANRMGASLNDSYQTVVVVIVNPKTRDKFDESILKLSRSYGFVLDHTKKADLDSDELFITLHGAVPRANREGLRREIEVLDVVDSYVSLANIATEPYKPPQKPEPFLRTASRAIAEKSEWAALIVATPFAFSVVFALVAPFFLVPPMASTTTGMFLAASIGGLVLAFTPLREILRLVSSKPGLFLAQGASLAAAISLAVDGAWVIGTTGALASFLGYFALENFQKTDFENRHPVDKAVNMIHANWFANAIGFQIIGIAWASSHPSWALISLLAVALSWALMIIPGRGSLPKVSGGP